MTKMGTLYRLEFKGLVSETPEALQKFKAICIANLELSVEDTMDALSSRQTSVLRVASSLGELEGYYEQLKAIGAKVAIVGPNAEKSSQLIPSGSSQPQHDVHSDEGEEELTFELEELLDLDAPLKPREPAPPKEYFLDVGEDLESSHHSDLEVLGFVEQPVQSSPPAIPAAKPPPLVDTGLSLEEHEAAPTRSTPPATGQSAKKTAKRGPAVNLELGPVPNELPLNDPGVREAQQFEDDFDLGQPAGRRMEDEPPASPFSLEPTAMETGSFDLTRGQAPPSTGAKQPSMATVPPLTFDSPDLISQPPPKNDSGVNRQPTANLQLKNLKPHSHQDGMEPAHIYISGRGTNPLQDEMSHHHSLKGPWSEEQESHGDQEFDPGASFRPFKPSLPRTSDTGLSRKQFMAVLGGGVSLIITVNWLFAPKPLQPSIPAVSDRTLAQMDAVPEMLNSLRNGNQSTLTVAGTKATPAFTMQAVATIEDPPVLKLMVSTPQPPELTLEEIGHGMKPRPWMRRAESDAVTLKAVSSNEWSANVPTYIFIERGPDRRRVAGNALVYLTLNKDRRGGELSVELTYSPPGDDRLPPSGSLIDATQDGAYLVAISAKVPLTKR